MIQRISLIFLTFIICFTSSAQYLSGEDAKRTFPGAESVLIGERTKLPKHITLSPETNMTVQTAMQALIEYANLPDGTSFEMIRRKEGKLGQTHHRFQQLINGVPILGGVYLFHTTNGKVTSMNGDLFNLEENNTQAGISKSRAIDIALEGYSGAKFGWETTIGGGEDKLMSEYPEPVLTLIPEDLNFRNNEFQLAYKMDVLAFHKDHQHRNWVYVDAATGEILAKENRICEIDVPTQVATNYSGTQEVLTDMVSSNLYRLRQTTYGNGITTLNSQNGTNTNFAIDFTHEDDFWGGEIGVFDRYALDAHYAAEQYYQYLLEYFDRNSIDDNGLELRMYVHYDENYANAFWNGQYSFYGDGGSGNLSLPLTVLDIVAHEFTHGMTDYTADLIYNYEPGALNESFSDIFGLTANFYARQQYDTWLIGPEATSSGGGIRNAQNPKTFGHPANFRGENWWESTGDSGGVHINSGVQNHWFYLLSEGGTGINDFGEAYEVEGIGWEKAVAIAYRNLSFYLTPGSQFDDAAHFGIISAIDLYGTCSPEYRAAVNAWHAVGLSSPAFMESSVDFESQRVYCNTPSTVQFFNNSVNYESVSWNFGDGGTSSQLSPEHTYTSAGLFDVSLTITSCDGTTETLVKENYIDINPEAGLCTSFIMPDTGTTVITECSGQIYDPGGPNGDYPNGVSAVLVVDPPVLGPINIQLQFLSLNRNPDSGVDILRIHDGPSSSSPLIGRYTGFLVDQSFQSTNGVFTIVFVSSDIDNSDGFSLSYSPANFAGAAEADFVVSDDTPALNAPVTFQDQSTYPGDYFWDFGDGNTSIEGSPIHQYTEPGEYTITQIITNCVDSDTITQNLTVGAAGILGLSPDSICVTLNAGAQMTASFNIANSGLGDLYYGLGESEVDWLQLGSQSGEVAPGENIFIDLMFDATDLAADTLYYNIPMESGDTSQFTFDFRVKLIVLPFPQANYDVETVSLCNGTYQFIDQTINPSTSLLWNFGDGMTSTDSLPIHTYQEEGLYDVSLLACNDLGCDSILQEQVVLVSFCDTLTIANTGSSFFTECNGLIYDQGGADGDYANNSDYIVTIAPTGADFVTLTFNKLQLQPAVDFLTLYDGIDTTAEVINSLTGSLAPGATFVSSDAAITLRFESNPFLAFDGFEVQWSCNGLIFPPTDAAFAYELNGNCTNQIELAATPSGTFDYIWDFGDGNTITTSSSELTYNYQSAGDFTVSLQVANALGSSTAGQMVSISDVPFALNATLSKDTVDLLEPFTMEAVSDVISGNYLWIPQIGDTLSGASNEYAYDAMGDYVIYLEVTDADGCMMFVEKTIHVTNVVGADELTFIEKFQVTPNPSNGQFTLSLGFTEIKDIRIQVFNTLGQIIHQEDLGSIDSIVKELNLNDLSSGIYFLSVVSDTGNLAVQRLMIQK